MSLQSNQFEDLLKYLDDETDKTLTIQKDDKQRVEKVKVSTNF
jgi:hypothetical protein